MRDLTCVVWGPPSLSRDGLSSPDGSPAVLGIQWALGRLGIETGGVCVCSLWKIAGDLPGAGRAASG